MKYFVGIGILLFGLSVVTLASAEPTRVTHYLEFDDWNLKFDPVKFNQIEFAPVARCREFFRAGKSRLHTYEGFDYNRAKRSRLKADSELEDEDTQNQYCLKLYYLGNDGSQSPLEKDQRTVVQFGDVIAIEPQDTYYLNLFEFSSSHEWLLGPGAKLPYPGNGPTYSALTNEWGLFYPLMDPFDQLFHYGFKRTDEGFWDLAELINDTRNLASNYILDSFKRKIETSNESIKLSVRWKGDSDKKLLSDQEKDKDRITYSKDYQPGNRWAVVLNAKNFYASDLFKSGFRFIEEGCVIAGHIFDRITIIEARLQAEVAKEVTKISNRSFWEWLNSPSDFTPRASEIETYLKEEIHRQAHIYLSNRELNDKLREREQKLGRNQESASSQEPQAASSFILPPDKLIPDADEELLRDSTLRQRRKYTSPTDGN